jgi:hypothetical protein
MDPTDSQDGPGKMEMMKMEMMKMEMTKKTSRTG